MSQLHEDVDLGHTVAGWAGWAVAVTGTAVAGAGMCGWRPGLWLGSAICALAVTVTWVLHLLGWGKPAGPRPRDQWDWRVRDLAARTGHPDCTGCRLAGRYRRPAGRRYRAPSRETHSRQTQTQTATEAAAAAAAETATQTEGA